ncbi:hypothetical protein A2U01_0001566, partial [Trifolium medium]|nr:hypothetical protein [Trifolium medium]
PSEMQVALEVAIPEDHVHTQLLSLCPQE